MKSRLWLLCLLGSLPASLCWPAPCVGDPYVYRTIDVPGAAGTEIFGINNHGHVVGGFTRDYVGFGFFFDGETFTTLTFPGAGNTTARGINDRGQIVGSTGEITPTYPEHAFLFEDGEYTTLDSPDAESSIVDARDINNLGQVTGTIRDAEGAHAFLLDGEEIVRITVPGAINTYGEGLNDAGVVVGSTYEYDDELEFSYSTGFRHDAHGFEFIHYSGMFSTSVSGINNRGQIVGSSSPDPRDWKTRSFPLNGFPGAIETMPLDINDRGQIVGVYWDSEYDFHGFVATLVPEPSTWILLLGGGSCAVCLVWRKRGKSKDRSVGPAVPDTIPARHDLTGVSGRA